LAAETAPYVAKTRVEPDDVIEKMRPPRPISPFFTTPCDQYTSECAMTSSVMSMFALFRTSSPT
jgi:hypothetical protein